MVISKDIVEKIEAEFKAWEEVQYAGKDLRERQKFRTVFHPSSAHCEDAGEVQ